RWLRIAEQSDQDEFLPESCHPGRRAGPGQREQLRVQPRRPAGKLGASYVGGSARLPQEPQQLERLGDRGNDGYAGGGRSRPLTVTSRNRGRLGSAPRAGLAAGPTSGGAASSHPDARIPAAWSTSLP